MATVQVEQPEVEKPEVEQPEVEQPEVEQPEVEQPVSLHKELLSKEDFDTALQIKNKYVLIFAHTGEVPPQAEKAAKHHAHNTAAFQVHVEQFPTAKENLKLSEFPAIVVFKDGAEIKRAEGLNPEKAREIADILV